MYKQGFSQKVIAETIKKDKSVVSRELRRNRNDRGEYMPVLANAKHIVDGTGDGTTALVPDLVVDSIEPADGIDGIKGAGLPFLELRQNAVGDGTDGLCRQAGIELAFKIPADIARTRPTASIVSRLRTV